MLVPVSVVVAKFAAALLLAGPPCLVAPVHGPISDPFRPPACAFCPGNRGIEYATTAGAGVVAAAAGVVTFAGFVAGTRYVVVDHGGGYRTTYGRLESISVASGARVVAGQTVGVASSATFFGLRLGDAYLDPAPFLAQVVPQPRLVPLDGHDRRPPPPLRMAC